MPLLYRPYERTQQAMARLGDRVQNLSEIRALSTERQSAQRLKLAELGMRTADITSRQEIGKIEAMGRIKERATTARYRADTLDVSRKRQISTETYQTGMLQQRTDEAAEKKRRGDIDPKGPESLMQKFFVRSGASPAEAKQDAADFLEQNPEFGPIWNIPMSIEKFESRTNEFFKLAREDKLAGMEERIKTEEIEAKAAVGEEKKYSASLAKLAEFEGKIYRIDAPTLNEALISLGRGWDEKEDTDFFRDARPGERISDTQRERLKIALQGNVDYHQGIVNAYENKPIIRELESEKPAAQHKDSPAVRDKTTGKYFKSDGVNWGEIGR